MGGSCTPNQADERDCGRCGTQTRRCEASCGWGDWSACSEPPGAVCNEGQTETSECGESAQGECRLGETTRSCDSACRWNSWSSCVGAVYPQTEVCGSRFDEDCDGTTQRIPDEYEQNNTCATCANLMVTDPAELVIRGTIDSYNDDWDYYCFQGDDYGLNPLENIVVELRNIPSGSDYDLFLYKSIANCMNNTSLSQSSNAGNEDEEIDWGEGFNSGDTGTYVIGVKQFNNSFSCQFSYELYIDGLR
jgi:hypothetical protein